MRLALTALASAALAAACASAPSPTSLQPGTQAAFDGRVESVDTAPWAYDGNATVVVSTTAGQRVRVQLPARWNLCKAPSVDATALKPGDRVQVVGTVVEADSVTVCERAEHRLQRAG